MSRSSQNTIAAKLKAAGVVINNTLNDAEIQALVAGMGYPAEKMREGLALLQSATELVNAQVAGEGGQAKATVQVKTAKKAAESVYHRIAEICRARFGKKPELLAELGLQGGRPRALDGFLLAVQTLFNNIPGKPEVKAVLQERGYDDAKLAAEKVIVDDLAVAVQAQKKAKGAKEQATDAQNRALKELKDWLAEYKKIAESRILKKEERKPD